MLVLVEHQRSEGVYNQLVGLGMPGCVGVAEVGHHPVDEFHSKTTVEKKVEVQ